MGYPESKPVNPAAAAGVKDVIASRARSRRETQRALNEIDLHAPRPRPQRSRPEAPLGDAGP